MHYLPKWLEVEIDQTGNEYEICAFTKAAQKRNLYNRRSKQKVLFNKGYRRWSFDTDDNRGL